MKTQYKVHKHTRAGKYGKELKCPNCGVYSYVYHFSWCGMKCQGCDTMVNKQDWWIEK